MTTKKSVVDTRLALLEAAVLVLGQRGYAGTSVDDICKVAGVTKGSFFHYFGSKEELVIAAVEHFAAQLDNECAGADYRKRLDPKERVMGYVGFRHQQMQGEVHEFSCLMGMMVQEVYLTHPHLREVCGELLLAHAATLEADLRAAKALYAPRADWDVKSVALHIQAVLQGAFVMAKATGGGEVALASVQQLLRYLGYLLPRAAV